MKGCEDLNRKEKRRLMVVKAPFRGSPLALFTAFSSRRREDVECFAFTDGWWQLWLLETSVV